MAGAYCRYCGSRCFVVRVIDHGPARTSGPMATCRPGAERDRSVLGGFDHGSARNPILFPEVPPLLGPDDPEPPIGTLVRDRYGAGDHWLRVQVPDHGSPLRTEWVRLRDQQFRSWGSVASDRDVIIPFPGAVAAEPPDEPVHLQLYDISRGTDAIADSIPYPAGGTWEAQWLVKRAGQHLREAADMISDKAERDTAPEGS